MMNILMGLPKSVRQQKNDYYLNTDRFSQANEYCNGIHLLT